jgi:hypothetical protein
MDDETLKEMATKRRSKGRSKDQTGVDEMMKEALMK